MTRAAICEVKGRAVELFLDEEVFIQASSVRSASVREVIFKDLEPLSEDGILKDLVLFWDVELHRGDVIFKDEVFTGHRPSPLDTSRSDSQTSGPERTFPMESMPLKETTRLEDSPPGPLALPLTSSWLCC